MAKKGIGFWIHSMKVQYRSIKISNVNVFHLLSQYSLLQLIRTRGWQIGKESKTIVKYLSPSERKYFYLQAFPSNIEWWKNILLLTSQILSIHSAQLNFKRSILVESHKFIDKILQQLGMDGFKDSKITLS